ncbi:MAG TPA: serine/threonine-protein kinase [Bryobacteraceae bacterium]|nr:serine/threonine-protein kinase [Bryobacteraceae bacterium]
MTLDVGTQIGDYRILSRIGRGTYGIVFEAEHVITRQIHALKVMLDTAGLVDEGRFLREIQVQAKMQHPNIAGVYQAFRAPCGLVLAMERVTGESLRTVLDRGRLPRATGLQYIMDTLAGLDFAEQAGVIHRDIKPENIMITPEGRVKITDFGLAHVVNCGRITGSEESLGTPWYIAPEQVDGKGIVDARTDVYSTGVVLYEVATGRLPFPGTNAFAVVRAHLEKEPTPPVQLDREIGASLSAVILKAMEKAPSRRFPGAAAFRASLEAAAPIQTIVRPRGAEQRGGFPWLYAAAAAIVGLGIWGAFMAGGYWNSRQNTAATPATVEAVPEEANGPGIAKPTGGRGASATAPGASSGNMQARSKKAPGGSTARTGRTKSVSPSFANVEGRYVIGQQGELNPPAPAPVAKPVVSAAPAAPAAVEAAASSPQTSKPEAVGPEPKKHNVVVRVFGKIFHKKAKHPENDSDAKDQKPGQKSGDRAAVTKPEQ